MRMGSMGEEKGDREDELVCRCEVDGDGWFDDQW